MRRNTPKSHDELVKQVARHLKQRFYRDIRARTEGFPPPEEIASGDRQHRYVPDITVVARGTQFHIVEVETPQSLSQEHTANKWAAFGERVEEATAKFTVVVPRGSGPLAKSQLQELNLEAGVWEI